MSAPHESKRPIIVKRAAPHDEEHGGQWKVAYADFVTAMMAFFLIMWLLSSATQPERAVIAKYFSSTSLFDLPAGNGVLNGGRSVLEGADAKPDRGTPTAKTQTQAPPAQAAAAAAAASARDRTERQRMEAVKAELERMMTQGELAKTAGNISVEMTQEGLRIQIFDRDGEPMFPPAGTEPMPRLKLILGVVAQVLGTIQNKVILSGHTDAQPLPRAGYSNWELSADRANAARRVLETAGLAPSRILRVEGRAAVDPLLPQAPLDPRNRRIAVTILRSEVEAQWRSSRMAEPPSP
jgi:chemotaxis protein MotB